MTKLLSLLLSTLFAAALVACAAEGDEPDLEPLAEAEAEVEVEVPTAEEGVEAEARPKGTPCVVASGHEALPLPCPPPPPDDAANERGD